MHRYPFIFSDERKYRLGRHLSLWFCWWLFQSFLYSFVSISMSIPYFDRLPVSSLESLVYLGPHIFLSYGLMYWTLPYFLLRGRYIATVFSVIGLFLATAAISALIGLYVLNDLKKLLGLRGGMGVQRDFYLALLAGLRGGITVGGLAAAIKLMKYWYMKEQRNLQLQKENAESQLQLLKAQVHPHFLFNTLNNIYSYTQNTSGVASKLVMGLSDMLRYMLYDCNQQLVPLQSELKMLRDYILLEDIRYDNKLDLNIDLPSETEGLYIAPLLLLPFVENCFKHGTSHMLEQPWISLSITIDDRLLVMKLLNGKAQGYHVPERARGIGIINAKQRLELLYQGRHQLKISDTEDVFIVTLKLQLERLGSIPAPDEKQLVIHD
ncbi:MAG TPA: histidine kinase [Flavisolibacter sp.]|nr:histidine kinase [Flavisolibacter sp.]